MCSNFLLLWVFVIIWQPTFSLYDVCPNLQNVVLSDEECLDLYFEYTEKTAILGQVKLELDVEDGSLKVTPLATTWSNTFLRLSSLQNETNQFCAKLTKTDSPQYFCLSIKPEMENETFLFDYKIENLPEISSRKFLFNFPNLETDPVFLYIDQTDTNKLILIAQKVVNLSNNTYYKVEAYKRKNSNTNLQDFRLFSNYDDIQYELFTYNDMGNYYFVVSVLSDDCENGTCMKLTTPEVVIKRKSTRVVIGIVGASFILPFVLFIFHILTRKYPEENQSVPDEKFIIAYKSSTKKHNEVVFALANLLQKMAKTNQISVDIVDISKTVKKYSNIDSLSSADKIIYVAPPKNDLNPIPMDKTLTEREFLGVIFDHCTDKLPDFFDSNKIFKLFDDFDKFIRALNMKGSYSTVLYQDLKRKSHEAEIETEKFLNDESLPKIIITESEPQERDSLITTKIML